MFDVALAKEVNLTAEPVRIAGMLRNGLLNALQRHQNRFVKERLRGRPGLISQRGFAGLIGSIKTEVVGDTIETINGVMYFGPPGARYAATHEFGATIRPKRGKYLTIPINGTEPGDRIGDFDGGRFVPSKSGFVYLDAAGKARFALVREVTIPKRLGWLAAFEAARPAIIDDIKKAVTF